MKVDNLVTFDNLSFGFVAKRNNLFIVNFTYVKSSETGYDYFVSFAETDYSFIEKSVNSFFDCFFC